MKRKIAAILAADIVGYSRLVGEDEEETLRRLDKYRAVFADFIARAGGRIFNTAGDAILAEFPSAVEAVRCAVDTQESLRTRNLAYPSSRQMNFRIGITIGDVVEREGDLLGEGVNIASRLESIAPAGGICISRSVHEAVANKISLKFADVGEQQLKNLPDRVHAYTVTLDPFGTPTTVPIPPPTRPVPKAVWLGVGATVAAMLAAGIYLVGFAKHDSAANQDTTERVAETKADTATRDAHFEPKTEPQPESRDSDVHTPPKLKIPADILPPPETDETTESAMKSIEDPPAAEAGDDVTAVDPAEEEEEDTTPGTDDSKCADANHEKVAIRACTRLLDQSGLSSTDRSTYYMNRGAAYLNLSEYDRAIGDLDEALRLLPDDQLTLYNRGATYFYKGDYDRAFTDLSRSVKLDPKHAKGQFYLGRTLQEQGKFSEAVAPLTRAIALEPEDASYRRFRADAYLDSGDYPHAITDYDEAIRIDPRYAEAFRGRGITWNNEENNTKAIADLTEAIRLEPKDWYAYYVRAGAYTTEKRYDDAIADYNEALLLEPNNTQILNGRADARLKAGRLDEAWGDIERALGIDPNYAVAITTRGEIYEAQGNSSAAIDDFRRALALDATLEDAKNGLERLEAPRKIPDTTSSDDTEGSGGPSSCTKFLASVGKTIPVPCD